MKNYEYLAPFLVFAHVLTGCPSKAAQDAATVAANTTREIAYAEHQLILSYCVPKYKEAVESQDVKDADKVCLPAEVTYMATKSAWEALLIVLQSAKAGNATDAEVRTAAEKLASSLAQLKQIAETMR